MDFSEMEKWWSYYKTEPFGANRDDLRMAISTASLIQIQSPKARVKFTDFLPNFYEESRIEAPRKKREQHSSFPDDSLAVFRALTITAGGTVISPSTRAH